MLRFNLRRLHRWLTLVFALPLIVVIGTGLILSFEPLIQQARPELPVTLSTIEDMLSRHDPDNRARSLSIRTFDNTLTLGGVGADGSIVADLRTGAQITAPQRMAQFLLTSRRLHETLLIDLDWLVTTSTIGMLAIMSLGMLLGWPRFRNSLGGWHQGSAWLTLPLLILSPLTGLALGYGITFTSPPAPSSETGRVTMRDAVRLIAANHDLGSLTSIRQRGRILMARTYVGGELRGYRVGPSRLEPIARNWPRVIHEGNWGGWLGPLLNVLTSVVLVGLVATGVTIWLRGLIRRSRAVRTSLRPEQAAS